MRLIFERTGRNAVKSWMVYGQSWSKTDDSDAATLRGLQLAPILPGWPGRRPRPAAQVSPAHNGHDSRKRLSHTLQGS